MALGCCCFSCCCTSSPALKLDAPHPPRNCGPASNNIATEGRSTNLASFGSRSNACHLTISSKSYDLKFIAQVTASAAFPTMEQNRTVRPPPRRNLFHGTRRGNPTAVRPDTAQQPTGEELVERAPNGEYSLYAPQTVYKHMALGLNAGRETDEEAGMSPKPL